MTFKCKLINGENTIIECAYGIKTDGETLWVQTRLWKHHINLDYIVSYEMKNY